MSERLRTRRGHAPARAHCNTLLRAAGDDVAAASILARCALRKRARCCRPGALTESGLSARRLQYIASQVEWQLAAGR